MVHVLQPALGAHLHPSPPTHKNPSHPNLIIPTMLVLHVRHTHLLISECWTTESRLMKGVHAS